MIQDIISIDNVTCVSRSNKETNQKEKDISNSILEDLCTKAQAQEKSFFDYLKQEIENNSIRNFKEIQTLQLEILNSIILENIILKYSLENSLDKDTYEKLKTKLIK